MTVRAGVAGQPIGHSLSPLIHGAWIAAAGLDARYEAYGPADQAAFLGVVDDQRRGRIRGLNVTSPFKEAALAAADEAGEAARLCGSANLLVFEAGRLRADSTDGEGLLAALPEQAPALDIAGRAVVILGAGGAARAAAAALKATGGQVGVLNRTRGRAEALATALGVEVAEPGDLGDAALVVNALSVPPEIDIDRLRPDAVLMDMTYRPLLTPFLRAGRMRGLTTVDGLSMLIGQARPSFRAIFGVEPPVVDVRAVALEALGEVG